jgi:hypothetical protein
MNEALKLTFIVDKRSAPVDRKRPYIVLLAPIEGSHWNRVQRQAGLARVRSLANWPQELSLWG